MKKYVKPLISFHELSLSTSISAGCAITSNQAPAACPIELPGHGGLTVFPEGTCMAYFPGVEDSLCYHVPTADMNVFES
jgi:hypothetical protein